MILEYFDTEERVLRLDLEGRQDSSLSARLASLVMVAGDCGIASVECLNLGRISGPGREAALEMIERNGLFSDAGEESSRDAETQDGYWLISRDEQMLCLGRMDGGPEYSVFVSPERDGAGRASVFAHIISCVLGFSSFVSFEVRFSVFELLGRIVESAGTHRADKWVRLLFRRDGEALSVTVVDKESAQEASEDSATFVDGMPGSGLFRRLGPETARRISGLLGGGERNDRIIRYREPAVRKAGDEKNGEDMVRFDLERVPRGGSEERRICLQGDLDSVGALMLEQFSGDLVSSGVRFLDLDFEEVSFVSSAGVGILLGMVSSMRGRGGDVRLHNVSGKIISVLRMLNLEEYFTIVAGNDRVTA